MANCTTYVKVEDLFFEGNVRSTACQRIPEMVASLKRAGCFKGNHPLVVSLKEKDTPHLLVLNGNRRGLGLCWLRDNDPTEYKRICPTGKIPAIVHKGLTVEDEVDLRIDHSADEDRVPLDEWSVFLAVKQLVSIGHDTQEEIARKLGLFKSGGKDKGKPNRSVTQSRCNLAKLPSFVQDEYRKLCLEGKDATPVRWANVAILYTAHRDEAVAHPLGDGPEFAKAWALALTPAEKKVSTDSGKDLTPKAALDRSLAASSNGLKTALLAATNQGDGNLATIDAAILDGETAVLTLDAIRQYLGENDYAELVSNATTPPVDDVLTDSEIGELIDA